MMSRIRLAVCPHWRRGEALTALNDARESLAAASRRRVQARDNARSLHAARIRNHFREGVEFQLRGDGRR